MPVVDGRLAKLRVSSQKEGYNGEGYTCKCEEQKDRPQTNTVLEEIGWRWLES